MNEQLKEAMNYLKGGNLFGELSTGALASVEQLIEKEKPMKPLRTDGSFAICDYCDNHIPNVKKGKLWLEITQSYCSGCGQRLDWSEYNE